MEKEYVIYMESLQVIGISNLNSRLEIDEIDVRILKILLKNARTGFAEIAKECKMSTNAIRMRFMRLKKTGVITGSTIEVIPKSLGYEGVAFLAIEADVNKERDVLTSLEKMPNAVLSHPQIGKHNIISILIIRNIGDLVRVLEWVTGKPYVKKAETAIATSSSRYYPENLVIEPFKGPTYKNSVFPDENKQHKGIRKKSESVSESIGKKQVTPSIKLDKIDLGIIRTLAQNSRISFRQVAKNLGISTKTVIQRYEKLRENVIQSATITLNLKKLGYVSNAIFCLNTSQKHKITDILKKIVQLPNIILATSCVGGIDALAIAPLANFEQLFKLKQQIAKISGIKQMEILLEETYSTWPPNMVSKKL